MSADSAPIRPSISVVVPVFNASAFLPDSLGSVLANTAAPLEVICVDDASTDDSLAVLRRLASVDPRISILSQPINQGPSAARNRGIDAARGDFVFFLDADDYVPAGALDHLHSAATESGCGLAMGQLLWLKTEDDGTGANAGQDPAARGAAPVRVETVRESVHLQSVPGCHCCNLYSRRMLGEAIRYHVDLGLGEDQLFQAEAIVAAQRVAVVETVVYVYHHYRGQSITRRPPVLKNLLDDIEFQCRIARLFSAHGLHEAGRRFLGAWSWSIGQYWVRIPGALGRDEAGQVFERFRDMFAEFQVPPWNQRTPPNHRRLLGLILSGEDDAALALLATESGSH